MIDLSTVSHHRAVEEMVDVICNRTQNPERHFFRVTSAYQLTVMASAMRATLNTKDRGELPINMYAMALAPSGYNKGHSINIQEHQFMADFKSTFIDYTLPMRAEQSIWRLAIRRAGQNGTEEQQEYDSLRREYDHAGEYPYMFDGGSAPAIKQIRQKLLIADAGAINLQVDEIGLHLEGSMEALAAYLELYDQGYIRNKITKASSDNIRTKEIVGKTPANMLLFGTPEKLLDGSKVESNFYGYLETGYARRCLFAHGSIPAPDLNRTAAEIYAHKIDPSNDAQIDKWATHFASLADPTKMDWMIDVPDHIATELIEYQLHCERLAYDIPVHESIRKAEMTHRYFKVLKLAGTYAFVDEALEMRIDHLHSAMKLVEESGEAFQEILTRERTYMKLARYIATVGTEVTHADLDETLPFYPKSAGPRTDMITMAIAWGYKQHIMLKKTFENGIEFFTGEMLKETSLDEVSLSYSQELGHDYAPAVTSFDNLHKLTQLRGYHWANHTFIDQNRKEEKVIPGFNLAVLDIDGDTPMDTVHELLKDYTFMTYTTKSHTSKVNRYRLIMPMNYALKLDSNDYVTFMENLVQWLPLTPDDSTYQRNRKWETYEGGTYYYSQGSKLLDILPFVPKTTKNEQFQKESSKLGSLDNLERWFAQNISEGNRNNMFFKYAAALVDSGMNYTEVEKHIISFNKKLSNGLSETELRKTVLVTVASKLHSASQAA